MPVLCSIKMHEERNAKQKDDEAVPSGAIPAYLMDREGETNAKVTNLCFCFGCPD